MLGRQEHYYIYDYHGTRLGHRPSVTEVTSSGKFRLSCACMSSEDSINTQQSLCKVYIYGKDLRKTSWLQTNPQFSAQLSSSGGYFLQIYKGRIFFSLAQFILSLSLSLFLSVCLCLSLARSLAHSDKSCRVVVDPDHTQGTNTTRRQAARGKFKPAFVSPC